MVWLGCLKLRAMNWTLVRYSAFFAWCISAAGCAVCQNAMRTIRHEPAAYSWKHDRRNSFEAYRQWADVALRGEAISCPDLFGNPDYAMGFRDGFVDFVYAGGTGEPPPVPPRHYWNAMLRSPEGKQRANQWFDGYRHGAAVARDGGYRDLGNVNSSLVGFAGHAEFALDSPLFAAPESVDIQMPLPDGEILPEPGTAPLLPPPFESNDAPAPASDGGPAAAEPAATPLVEEEPFRDDVELPLDEPGDQLRPIDESPQPQNEEENSNAVDSADGTMSLEDADAAAFEVQPAILLKLNDASDGQTARDATNKSSVSTAKFVFEPVACEAESELPNFDRMPRPVLRTTIGEARTDVNRHVFHGWSRRISTGSTLERITTGNVETPNAGRQLEK
jgi:hypothetical protein